MCVHEGRRVHVLMKGGECAFVYQGGGYVCVHKRGRVCLCS